MRSMGLAHIAAAGLATSASGQVTFQDVTSSAGVDARPLENRVVLDASGENELGDALALKHADHAIELTEADPMHDIDFGL